MTAVTRNFQVAITHYLALRRRKPVVTMAVSPWHTPSYTAVVKRVSKSTPVYVQNSILYGTGFIFNYLLYIFTRTPERSHFFSGYNNIGVIMLLCLNSTVGIIISFVYKYGDALLKTLAQPMSSSLLVFISYIFFGLPLDMVKASGAGVVIISTLLYIDLPSQISKQEHVKRSEGVDDSKDGSIPTQKSLIGKDHNFRGTKQISTLFLCCLLACMYISIDKSEVIVKSNDTKREKDVDILPQRKNIAVMVVGEGRSQGTFVWLSIQSYVIKPIIEYYEVPWVDAFICVGNSGEDKSLKEFMSSSNSSSNRVHFIETNITTEKKGIQQYRIDECYQQIQHQSSNDYDFIVKIRPDFWWFDSIALPFSTQHVMARARSVGGIKNVTVAHLSYINDCFPQCPFNSSIHTPCGMIDDIMAVVPYRHQDAFFRLNPSHTHTVGNRNTDDISNVEWTILPLSLSCPCLHKSWPEGILTSRLASLNVSVALTPFHVLLTEKEGWGFRWKASPVKRDFNKASPKCL